MSKINDLKITNQPKNPLFKLERKLNLSMLIIFSIITGSLLLLILVLYPTMKESFNTSGGTMDAILGMDSISSYFTMQSAQNWGLLASVYASVLGYKLVASNYNDGSNSFLYALNLSRYKILNTKLFRLIINVFLFNIICGVFSYVAMMIVAPNEFEVLHLIYYTLASFIVTLQVGLATFAITAISHKKINMFVAVLIPIAFIVISSIALMSESLEALKYFSPYVTLFYNIMADGLSAINYYVFSIWCAIAVILLTISYIIYGKKDLV